MSEQEHKTFFSPGSTEELHLFEQAQGPHGENGFAVYYEKDDQLNFDASYENMDEQVYNPLPRSLWPLPKFPNEQYRVSTVTDVKAVFDLVRGYIYEFVELPHDTLYDILSLWVVASYIPEKFDSVPYLTFLGPKDSGKTRALEVLWQLSYRSMLSPSFSSAALFRTVDQYGPTVCLDESEIYGSEQKTEAIAVLNAGYRKGQFVLRVKTENGSIDRFSCFSFKALASTKLFVSTLDSRSIGV
ncbi:MAG: hypothetical protein GTO23_08660, partial [Nitrososphaeria archaeon]|nr:hypothetical protein [Nitrososphaeria archaeon]